ncbi:proteinase inhibitor i78 [Asticcacaulis sp. EMRT-3]|uniref:proteinase inhibitor i78 n=1 Tax=Asticcacaulis sp. EMRT-3 TaxID=3040349 RepID=UPI0024AF5F48|nr:proteinase inhibitor i78 [Asticcacaulis sp. EMRT-3]MDI7774570.1 proteinase inhibitor i78 [Asticcacaulis sp. EMRT-3]
MQAPPAMTPTPATPSISALPQSASPEAPVATLKPMDKDQCGAQALQYLVGKPRTDIPVPLDPSSRRVVCSTCVTTQEFRADRQTITFNSDTGLITSVKCN